MFLAKNQAKRDGLKRISAQENDFFAMNSDSSQSIPALIKKAPAARGRSDNARFQMYQVNKRGNNRRMEPNADYEPV